MTHQIISAYDSMEGNGNMPCWRVGLREVSTGRQAEHVFPKAQLEWRAAEYGVDPTDIDTLLTIVLHEPHLEDPLPNSGQKCLGELLVAADNAKQARVAHLARIQAHPVTIDITSKYLDVIRQAPIDQAMVKVLTQHVDVNRWMVKYGDLPIPEPTGTPSHPKAPESDSMGVSPKARESLTVTVGSSNGADHG